MKKPNIVIINCDDLGYGDFGCFGNKLNKTPCIDDLAANGLKFTSYYSAAPVCSPSRVALLTGCYPARAGFGVPGDNWVLFPGDPVGLSQNEITIADILKEQGYATKLIGKWHCGDQKEFLPTKHGFDSYFGLPYSNDMGVQKGLEHAGYPPLPLIEDDEVFQEQPDQTGLTERYLEHSVRFIGQNKDNPFFLYLCHMYVHLPLYVPKRFEDSSENGSYGGAVECIDWGVSVIVDKLKDLGLLENTIIIITSDNGSNGPGVGGSNLPLRAGKFSTYEGGMRMPFIVYWKDKIDPAEINDMVTAMDILPTVAKLAGGKVPDDRIIDGMDMAPLFFGNGDWKRDTFFYYYMTNLEAVRYKNWKIHLRKWENEVHELYDLDNDIGETENLYDSRPDIVAQFDNIIESARVDLGDYAVGRTGANIRPIGRVEHPVTLTHYDENHPYIVAMYDLEQYG